MVDSQLYTKFIDNTFMNVTNVRYDKTFYTKIAFA